MRPIFEKIRNVVRYLSSSTVLPVVRATRWNPEIYDTCPHCASEIGEKAVFYDMDGIKGPKDTWYHRACGLPISFPEERTAALEPKHFDATIQVETRSIYGRDTLYVVSHHAEAVAALTGKKLTEDDKGKRTTVDANDVKALKALGFQVYDRALKKYLSD